MQPQGEYGALLNRIGEMSEREHKKTSGFSKIDEFTVCALRGFGMRKTVLGTRTYGAELEQCLRRQARIERDRLRGEKILFVITNRVAKGGSTGRFGTFEGEGAEDVSVTLADCFALDAVKYKSVTWGGAKLGDRKSEPRTISCLGSPGKQIELF